MTSLQESVFYSEMFASVPSELKPYYAV